MHLVLLLVRLNCIAVKLWHVYEVLSKTVAGRGEISVPKEREEYRSTK